MLVITGLAKLKLCDHHPGKAFLELFVGACSRLQLKGFNEQALANTIHGEESVWPLIACCRHSQTCALIDHRGASGLTGLGRFEHQPGEPFIRLFISRCLEVGLPNFATAGIAALICVSHLNGSYEVSFSLLRLCNHLHRAWLS
jgi:hypothetical protein